VQKRQKLMRLNSVRLAAILGILPFFVFCLAFEIIPVMILIKESFFDGNGSFGTILGTFIGYYMLQIRSKRLRELFEALANVTTNFAGAPHPNVAKLLLETEYSDEGQIEYAKGFVHPIRTSVKLPADVLEKFPPAEDYKAVSFVNDAEALGVAAEAIAKGWDEVAAIE